ncbi:YciI family protein [Roseateles sp. P5_E1]
MNQSQHEYLVVSRGLWDEKASREDVQRAIDQFYVWYEGQLAAGRMKPGSRLAPEGKLIAHGLVTDGPFAETKEIVGGYWFIVATSLEEAAELAAQNPCLAFGLTLEIRPLDAERARATDITNETPPLWRQR